MQLQWSYSIPVRVSWVVCTERLVADQSQGYLAGVSSECAGDSNRSFNSVICHDRAQDPTFPNWDHFVWNPEVLTGFWRTSLDPRHCCSVKVKVDWMQLLYVVWKGLKGSVLRFWQKVVKHRVNWLDCLGLGPNHHVCFPCVQIPELFFLTHTLDGQLETRKVDLTFEQSGKWASTRYCFPERKLSFLSFTCTPHDATC